MSFTNEQMIRVKMDFPLLANSSLVYLDSAATTQKPKVVINAIDAFSRSKYSGVHRGLYPLAVNATNDFEQARKVVAQFINADAKEIIFTSGTTASINGLSRSIHTILPKNRKKIVITEMEHHANLVPWQQFAKAHGYTLDYIPITGTHELNMQQLNAKLTTDVALLCITHVSNVLGTINPLKDICATAKRAGIITVIDGAQAIAHMEVDVADIDCDFYAFSGHKLYGPTGVGVLYGKYSLLEKLQPFSFGGHMIESVTKYDSSWAAIPQRFEAGTPPIIEVIGLAAAIKYVSEIGMDAIHKHEVELVRYTKSKLKEISGVKLYCGEENSGIISFTIDGAHAHDIASILGDDLICVRAGHHCAMPLNQVLNTAATARISFGVYNSTKDVDTLIMSLKKISNLFGGRR